MVERPARTFGIEPLQLFSATAPNEAFERLLQQGISGIKQVVRETVKETLAEEYKTKGRA